MAVEMEREGKTCGSCGLTVTKAVRLTVCVCVCVCVCCSDYVILTNSVLRDANFHHLPQSLGYCPPQLIAI